MIPLNNKSQYSFKVLYILGKFFCYKFHLDNNSSCHQVKDETLKVGVYFESLCPDSKAFITTQLHPTFGKLGKYMDVSFFPYGNAEVSQVNIEFSRLIYISYHFSYMQIFSHFNDSRVHINIRSFKNMMDRGTLNVNMQFWNVLETCKYPVFWTLMLCLYPIKLIL